MAITIIRDFIEDKFYTSVNQINTTIDSNNAGKCNFRYICEVYINGVSVYNNKIFPDPKTGYGFFQLSRIIQDYIKTTLPTPDWNTFIDATENGNISSVLEIQCKFGEEYDSSNNCDGTIKQYMNLATSKNFFVFESAIDYEDYLDFDYEDWTLKSPYYNKEIKFLTNSPRVVDITYNDIFYLDFLSFNTTPNIVYDVEFIGKKIDGSSTTALLTTKNVSNDRNRYRIAVGPLDLNMANNNILVDQTITSYTIQLRMSGSYVSERFTFNIKAPNKYMTRLGFIGQKGGIEHFTFYHRNKKRFIIDRGIFKRTNHRVINNNLTYEVGDRADTIYKVNAQELHSVSTFCSREASEWLYELYISPNQWTYKRPEMLPFKIFVEDSSPNSRVLFQINDTTSLRVGSDIFSFPDSNYLDLNGRFTIQSINGKLVDVGMTIDIYSDVVGGCGWIHMINDWSMLPIVVTDQSIEVKQKLERPIEYSLNYNMAFNKTTLR